MRTDWGKSFLAGISSLALAIITSFLSFFLLFLLAYPFGEVIGYISSDIVIIIACFLICRRNPSSIWYVPIICNIVGIIAAFGEENFYWISTLWIIICGGWVLSIIASIVGAMKGISNALSKNP